MTLSIDHFSNSGKIIARAVGPAAAYKLLEQFGGQSFYISRNPTAKHVASKKLGLAVHQALADLWPDQEFELPLKTFVDKRVRNDAIRADATRLSMRELVAKYTLSRGQIQEIIRGHQMSDNTHLEIQQLKLFEF
ncbi:Mor transcription activator family protein [Alteromonas sp. KUL49]|uniref:Mor transcription activator family protein n=1 Tax=Alteromonas sp. KUL49 TaxID=2480798 RepID=UPI00102F1BF6|nr:Mor transcription activator family protein [Alteromonas sp. KUL49]TAP38760.1 hypothetical protein EYS00_15265 [Alteromonas sp. KUL49]GEA12716.1 hypothetical protein KUL49_30910 [Alteromonas sp. KUL49]